jgi:hypothetical protein
MKDLENKKELNEVEEENVAGGMICPGIPPAEPFQPPYYPVEEKKDGSTGATGSW